MSEEEQQHEQHEDVEQQAEEEEQEQQEEDQNMPQANPFGLDFMQYLLHARLFDRHRASNNEGMVKNLKERGLITSESVERAFLAIPRGEFLMPDMMEEAYQDNPLRFASLAFNISAPHMYATCLEALQIEPGNRFLDIGSGCGHMTCLGGFLVGKTGFAHGVDIRQDIIDFAEANTRKFEKKYGIDLSNVRYFLRNCFLPDPEGHVYDRIHVGACCPEAHLKQLHDLLAPGGILVTPFSDKLIKVTKDASGNISTAETLAHVRYSDLIVPSDVEIRQAQLAVDRYRAMKVTIPDDALVADFASLVNNQKYSDVVFRVEGKPVYAHKFLLAFRCPFLFEFTKSASPSPNNNHVEVTIPAIPYDVFVDVLKYIYCGEITINPSNAPQVLQAAVEFHLPNLVQTCQSFLQSLAQQPEISCAPILVREPIAAELADLVNNERLHDVVFIVEGTRVYGHKLILAIRSNYFRSILMMGMKESGQSEISIPEVRRDTFISLLRFIYTGDAGVVTEDNAVELLEAANYFNEARLKCVCEEVFKRGVDVENVAYLLQVAARFEANQLRSVCTEIILESFDAVSQTPAFRDLDRELLVAITSEACKRLARASS